ncbi:deoxyribose-phosphate aldolase [Marinilabilia salmonicolor]|jgi:deoxyribose-phosphate aldolase|uniref:Deoxyribose-phosphate aldolase n=1 Tax=Marinilabilia salmonicolor TaxID=989 RepID=A0A2T0XSJ2_9BACT|nr:deoxyribose-phosphate aldolase [Marinilabilia salmonicolor]PRZ01903.1 deoxyribose-phosphate aldolase [Marinilabilia salmonicolor]RCW32019.1 deoxyribose-phosphate aldolase [Marinilabilia salmonicolor]
MEQSEQLLEKYEKDFQAMPEFPESIDIKGLDTEDNLKRIFSFIDLTTLNTTDSANSVQEFCDKLVSFKKDFPDMPLVGAVCVYPVFASVLKTRLGSLNVNRAVVSAGFPSSQTFLDLKVLETKKALDMGANEIDIVISVGEFLEGNHEFVMQEISTIKSVMGEAHLKVILETGALDSPQNIWEASIIAMEAGADFIKTSTGKMNPAATPEAVWVMVHAIKAFQKATGKTIGLKPAGGISTTDDALVYLKIVNDVLGEEWLTSERFRIGASRLANNLLADLAEKQGKPFEKYF